MARFFLRSPSLLILDEATAALDNLNEKAVQEAIEEAMIGKTVIAVAHRLTTLRNADRILVFDKGRVVESGTYHDLLEAGGMFTMFLYFIQRKRWLGDNPDFIRSFWEAYKSSGQPLVLLPLRKYLHIL